MVHRCFTEVYTTLVLDFSLPGSVFVSLEAKTLIIIFEQHLSLEEHRGLRCHVTLIDLVLVIQKEHSKLLKVVLKLNLLRLLAEANNARNDGWCQQGYMEKYKECLKHYIVEYSSLVDPPRE